MSITAKQFAQLQLKRGQRQPERESDLHNLIAADLRARRIYFTHSRMDKAATNSIGTTDFIIALPGGVTLWMEVKTAKGKLSREQSGVALLLKIAGHRWACVRSFEDYLREIK